MMTDFLVALAAAGRGQADAGEISRLIAQARAAGWQTILPALEAAAAR